MDPPGVAFVRATGASAAAAQLRVAWDFSGELFCNCSVTVLSCAEENAKADAAAAAAVAAGADDAAVLAAAAGARRKVHLSPTDALLIPAITCPAGSAAVMKIFYGEFWGCPVATRRCGRG